MCISLYVYDIVIFVQVVLVNQMTTRVREGGGSSLVPALGESWGHAPTIRVILHWQGGGQSRTATLYKAPHKPEASVNYQVTVSCTCVILISKCYDL